MQTYQPCAGQWYQSRISGDLFEVLTVSKDSHELEIQTLDGDIVAIAEENWDDKQVIPAPPPADWPTNTDWALLDRCR